MVEGTSLHAALLKLRRYRSASLCSPNTELHCFPEAPEGPGVLRLPILFCGPRPPAEAARRLTGSGFRPSHNSGESCTWARPCFDHFTPACGVWNDLDIKAVVWIKLALILTAEWKQEEQTAACQHCWNGYSRGDGFSGKKKKKTDGYFYPGGNRNAAEPGDWITLTAICTACL